MDAKPTVYKVGALREANPDLTRLETEFGAVARIGLEAGQSRTIHAQKNHYRP